MDKWATRVAVAAAPLRRRRGSSCSSNSSAGSSSQDSSIPSRRQYNNDEKKDFLTDEDSHLMHSTTTTTESTSDSGGSDSERHHQGMQQGIRRYFTRPSSSARRQRSSSVTVRHPYETHHHRRPIRGEQRHESHRDALLPRIVLTDEPQHYMLDPSLDAASRETAAVARELKRALQLMRHTQVSIEHLLVAARRRREQLDDPDRTTASYGRGTTAAPRHHYEGTARIETGTPSCIHPYAIPMMHDGRPAPASIGTAQCRRSPSPPSATSVTHIIGSVERDSDAASRGVPRGAFSPIVSSTAATQTSLPSHRRPLFRGPGWRPTPPRTRPAAASGAAIARDPTDAPTLIAASKSYSF